MPDDRNNDPVQSDFDDWLADEDADPIDPTAHAVDQESDAKTDAPAEAHLEAEDTESPVEQSGSGDDTEDTDENPFAPPRDESNEHDLSAAGVDDQESEPDPESDPDFEPGTVADAATDSGFEPIVDTGVGHVDEQTFDEQPVVEIESFDGGHEDTTGDMEIIVPHEDEPEVTEEISFGTTSSHEDEVEGIDVPDTGADAGGMVAVGPDTDPPFDFGEAPDLETKFDPFEDTGEAVFVTGETPVVGGTTLDTDAGARGDSREGASFAELWGVEDVTDQPPDGGDDSDDDHDETPQNDTDDEIAEDFRPDPDEFHLGTGDFHGQTREHEGLAKAIAAAETEETEKVALAAEIPGLESSVVGFEDVVQAEGYHRVRARGSGDLVARVITGLVLVVALVASLFWVPALIVLATAVFVLGAGEFYTALVRHDRKPIALFGFIGIIAACLGAYAWSAAAIPMAFVLAAVLLLLFYAVTPGKPDPMGNLALTTTVMIWAGLGSFAMLIAKSPDYRTLILGVVVTVAAADIAAYFVGRSIGRTHFAPWVSPKKTVEGLVAGVIVAMGIGAVLHFFPPFELTSGLAIGAVAAILTPLGDLAMSAAKRTLGLKDMGSVLPGHGGFLDRIDGLLFAIPAAWAVFLWAGLL